MLSSHLLTALMIICRIKYCGFILMKCVVPTHCKGCTVKILINERRLQDFSHQASKLFSPVPYPAIPWLGVVLV